jgi:hypothetical protein
MLALIDMLSLRMPLSGRSRFPLVRAFPRMLFFGLVQWAGASLLRLSLCNAEEESKDDCAVIA